MRLPRQLLTCAALALALVATACGTDNDRATDDDSAASSTSGCDEGVAPDAALLTPTSATGTQGASYSNDPLAPQSKSCAGMTTFLSTPQPGFDLQSYVFYGHLKDTSGKVVAFSTLSQEQVLGSASPTQMDGITVNAGSETTLGGVEGAPDTSDEISQTSNPWSQRSQSSTAGKAPQYVDARVVEGQLGEPGAVIELTAQVGALAADSTSPEPLQLSLRIRDVAGVGQWGYGPSGFFPQWIHPDQREAITNTYEGSVEKYLEATDDAMTNQGSYYYSSPVVDVERFTVSRGNTVEYSGTEGELLVDYVTQTFDAKADEVVRNGVQWTEFSVLFDDDTTMKLGEVTQKSVGTLPYAVILSADGSRHANGALEAAERWDIGDITITPDTSSTWTSPRSQKTYAMRYTAELKESASSPPGSLTFTAVYDDQEVSVGGRTVYEGLYEVSGTIDGDPVSGYAWAEIQPSGSL